MKVYERDDPDDPGNYLGLVYKSHGGWKAETPLFIISFHETQADAVQWLRDRVAA